MPQFVKVALVSDLAPGKARTVQAGTRRLALFNVDGKFHAIDNTCAHRGGPLGEGLVNGQVVTCPWHGWSFDVTTGQCHTNPAARVPCFEVRVEGNEIQVNV
ncbi:MAG: non-heme iron oxygenase ferredoxin subunit [Planctomycetota bacterium]